MANKRCVFYAFVCIFYYVNCLHFGCLQHSKYRSSISQSHFRLHSGADGIKGTDETDVTGSSSKDSSKYEIRSKLLEAALLAIRSSQAESIAANKKLSQQVLELTASYNLAQKNNCQLLAAMEKEKSEMEIGIRKSLDISRIAERRQLQDSESSTAENLKLKNRLVLLESAYRESEDRNKELQYEHSREVKALEGIIQESKQEKIDSRKTQENFIENTRNKMNVLKITIEDNLNKIQTLKDAVEEEKSAAMDLQDKLEESELLIESKEIEFKNEVKIISMKAAKEIENIIMEETEKRKLFEKSVREDSMKEKEQNDRNRKEIERIMKDQNDAKMISSKETFSDFLKRNVEDKKRKEIEENNKIEQAYLLQQQKDILAETVKLFNIASDRKMSTPAQITDSFYTEDMKEQKRLLEKQTEMLESLVSKVSSMNNSIPLQSRETEIILEQLQEERREGDVERMRHYERRNGSEIDCDHDSGSFQVEVANHEETANTSPGKNDRRISNQAAENFPRNIPEYDELGDELRAATSEAKSTISSLFSRFFSKISNSTENNDTNSAQKNRLKIARKSGRIIRNFGGVLAKSATDTLGFWVGLGFDDDGEEEELEVEDSSGRGVANADRKRVRQQMNDNQDSEYDRFYARNDNFIDRSYDNNLLIGPSSIDIDVAVDELTMKTDESVSNLQLDPPVDPGPLKDSRDLDDSKSSVTCTDTIAADKEENMQNGEMLSDQNREVVVSGEGDPESLKSDKNELD